MHCVKLPGTLSLGLAFSVMVLVACTTAPFNPATQLQIDGLFLENRTSIPVSAARIMVPATGSFVSCGYISPQSICSTTFPEAAYTGNPVEITWSQNGQIYSTGQFVIRLPDGLEENIPAVVNVVIAGPGSAATMLVQRQKPFMVNPLTPRR